MWDILNTKSTLRAFFGIFAKKLNEFYEFSLLNAVWHEMFAGSTKRIIMHTYCMGLCCRENWPIRLQLETTELIFQENCLSQSTARRNQLGYKNHTVNFLESWIVKNLTLHQFFFSNSYRNFMWKGSAMLLQSKVFQLGWKKSTEMKSSRWSIMWKM